MKAEILCVGTELLLGDIVNTNAAFLARSLAGMGIEVYHQSVVGDNPQRLEEALTDSFKRCDIVLMTGGLGPTCDDLTKETVAKVFDMPMEMNENCLRGIETFFSRIGRPMTENNRKQAMIPTGAVVFENHSGTAPGIALEKNGKTAILMPGPPREMTAMWNSGVEPYLAKQCQTVLISETVHLFGIGEAMAEEQLRDMMQSMSNPTVAPYAKDGEVLLRITASAKNELIARGMIAPVVNQICELMKEYVYGVNVMTLQNALVQELRKQGLHIATAESCTGGLVSKRITEISGCSEVFDCGICSYANSVKESVLGVLEETLTDVGAVSRQTAAEMAEGVRRLSGADIGISITGIAGPSGGTDDKPVGLVYVGVDSPWHCEVLELTLARGYADERELIRTIASSHALHLALKTAQKFQAE